MRRKGRNHQQLSAETIADLCGRRFTETDADFKMFADAIKDENR